MFGCLILHNTSRAWWSSSFGLPRIQVRTSPNPPGHSSLIFSIFLGEAMAFGSIREEVSNTHMLICSQKKITQSCIPYGGYRKYMKILGAILNTILVGGIPTPLKNDGVRQLGWLFQIHGNIKFMFQTTNQSSFIIPFPLVNHIIR